MIRRVVRSILMISMALALGVIIAQAQDNEYFTDGSKVGAPPMPVGNVADPRADINIPTSTSEKPQGSSKEVGINADCPDGTCPDLTASGAVTPDVTKAESAPYRPGVTASASSSGAVSNKTDKSSAGKKGGGTDGGKGN